MVDATKQDGDAPEDRDHLRGKALKDHIIANGGFVCYDSGEQGPHKRPAATLLRRLLEVFRLYY